MLHGKHILILGSGLTLFVLLVGCRKEVPASPSGLHVTVAFGSAPVSLDPHITNESISFAVNSNIYETLVRNDADLNLVPSLATAWTNPDDLTWVFTLDSRARFHNGKACTSADVAYSLERLRSDPKSDWKGDLVCIDRIEAPARDRIVIHTSSPCPTLLRSLAPMAIVPRDARDLDTKPIGTGPYRFVSIDTEKGVIQLQRWPGYRGKAPQVEEGTFRWILDNAGREQALHDGSVDLITDVPPEDMGHLRSNPGIQTHQVPSLRLMFLAFDMERANSPYVSVTPNPFLDPRVRRACALAIHRGRVVRDVFHGYAQEATELVAPAVFGFHPGLPGISYSPDEARRLMKEAGHAQGFTVTLDAPENAYSGDSQIASLTAEFLKEIGIDVQVNRMEKDKLFRKLYAHDTSFYEISWNCLSADAQEVFTCLLHSPDAAHGYGLDNYGGYSRKELDRLMEQAAQQMDSGKRLELWHQAMTTAMEDVPWVPISVQTHLYAVRSSLEWKPRPDRVVLLSEISAKQEQEP